MGELSELSFEEAMELLETVSARLSAENVPLDEAIELYEKGVEYYTLCKGKLEDANRRIQTIEKSIAGDE